MKETQPMELTILDKLVFTATYREIDKSAAKWVAGSTVWDILRINPGHVPSTLQRLVKRGLLVKDATNSSSRTKVYGPTDTGYRLWGTMRP